jgi:hypothetical protein
MGYLTNMVLIIHAFSHGCRGWRARTAKGKASANMLAEGKP